MLGGLGSGRWHLHNKKMTVEDCLVLSITKLSRDGLITRRHVNGSLWWTNTATGERTASLGYSLEPVGEEGLILRLRYTVGRDGDKQEVDEPIRLQTTYPHFGGIRWWFTCPLVVDGKPCNRRAGKLYLPPGGRYFGCRTCYDLTYTSSQESHKYDRLFALIASDIPGMTPKDAERLLSRRWGL